MVILGCENFFPEIPTKRLFRFNNFMAVIQCAFQFKFAFVSLFRKYELRCLYSSPTAVSDGIYTRSTGRLRLPAEGGNLPSIHTDSFDVRSSHCRATRSQATENKNMMEFTMYFSCFLLVHVHYNFYRNCKVLCSFLPLPRPNF